MRSRLVRDGISCAVDRATGRNGLCKKPKCQGQVRYAQRNENVPGLATPV